VSQRLINTLIRNLRTGAKQMTNHPEKPHHTVYAHGYYGDEWLYTGEDQEAAERAFRAGECEYINCVMWIIFGNGKVALRHGKNSKSQWKQR
jgi:hypothetical protein